jgi:hypothetical protein
MRSSASYLNLMSRQATIVALVLLGFGALALAATSRPPVWLRQAAQSAASHMSDRTVPTTISYIGPSARFPRVVLTGSFVCNDCSHGPSGAPAPTGTVTELRFDAKTHQSRDFALCKTRAECDASLCSFGGCTRAQDALDAAFSALGARLSGIPGDPDPFSHRSGTFSCHIRYPVPEMRYLIGSCTTAVRLQGSRAATVSFVERWRPREYEHGGWVRLPTRTHIWRVVETEDGWQTRISSSGSPAPQLPAGMKR